MPRSRVPSEKNLICHEKNLDWNPRRILTQSLSWIRPSAKPESIQTSQDMRAFRWVLLLISPKEQSLPCFLDLRGDVHDPKMMVDPIEKIMLSRSVELLDANPPKPPTWRASCRCFNTDSLSWGYPGQLFGFRRVRNSTVNARDSRFILIRAIDH
jgi:hypothetical protein